MHAVTLSGSGGPEVLVPADVDKPSIMHDNQLRIRIIAAGINPIDTKIRAAADRFPITMPAILGCDGAGVVEEIGNAVTEFKPGDEVYYCQCGFNGRQGNYAQYAVVDQVFVAHKPHSLDFIQAAAVPLVLITAWEALFERVRVHAGDTVLVHAGAGGVGHIAIQLAKDAGAKVITTVSNQAKADFVTGLGADKAILYKDSDVKHEIMHWTDDRGVDIAFDTVGGQTLEDSFTLVRPYGDVVTILAPTAETNWGEARMRNLRFSFELMLTPTLMELGEAKQHQGVILRQCAALFDEGKLRVEVAKTFPLADAAAAHRFLENEHPIGKVVLTCEE